MRLMIAAATALAMLSPVSANASTTITFNGVCASTASSTQAACTAVNGSYGNAVTLNGTNDATLRVRLSAWQANQSTNVINSAFLGAFGNGFGVTGVNDSNGASNLHTFDNVTGYTDFVMLQFNRAVNLTGINRSVYSVGGANPADSDASFINASAYIQPGVWNEATNLAGYTNLPNYWTALDGGSGSGSTSISSSGFSSVWLVGASMLSTDRDDGFKLKQIMVTPQTPAVPEPATWAMLILGFGAIGHSLRRRGGAPVLA